jgi:hypothetical protein
MSNTTTFDGPFLAVPLWAVNKIAADGTPSTLQLLCAFVENMNIRTKSVTLSLAEVASMAGVSRETAKRGVRWMVFEQILSVKRPARTKNTYVVMYVKPSQVGSPMTHGRVTHDPPVGAPMTHGRVTHDPSSTPKQHDLAGDMQISIENTKERNINENMKRVCDQERASEVILGSDPHEAPKERPSKNRQRKASPEVHALAQAFLNHRTHVMRMHPTHTDVQILRRAIRLLLDSGLTPVTVRQMIDTFCADTRFSQYKNPITAFSSRKIQKLLLAKISPEVSVDNDILSLLANDFVRDGLDLAWEQDCDDDLRKAITSRAMEAVYRYPEVVAEIAQHWSGDFKSPDFLSALSSLESLIRTNIGIETADVDSLLNTLDFLTLPKCMISGQPRPAAGTIVEAIYLYRRATNV